MGYARFFATLAVLLAPFYTSAAAPRTFSDLANLLVSIMNAGTAMLLVLGIVVYFWGMSVNILEFENKPETRKKFFFWGIIVLFIMFSIWGILQLLQNTLFNDNGGMTTTPTTSSVNVVPCTFTSCPQE